MLPNGQSVLTTLTERWNFIPRYDSKLTHVNYYRIYVTHGLFNT